MSKRAFLFLALLTVVILNAFPLYQAVTGKGRLYYTNAFDEAYYLQYDFSQKNQRLSRPGQYLVTLAHQAGLSGGWINLVFDGVFVTAFLFLVRALFKAAGYDDTTIEPGVDPDDPGPLALPGVQSRGEQALLQESSRRIRQLVRHSRGALSPDRPESGAPGLDTSGMPRIVLRR